MQTPTLQTTKPVASSPPSSVEPNLIPIDRTGSYSPQFSEIMEQHPGFSILDRTEKHFTKEFEDPEVERLVTNSEEDVSPMEPSPELLQQKSTVSLLEDPPKASLALIPQNEGGGQTRSLVTLNPHPSSNQEDVSASPSPATIATASKHHQLRSPYELALLPLDQNENSFSEQILNNITAAKPHSAALKTGALPPPSSPLHQPTIHTIQSASVVTNIAQSMEATNPAASLSSSNEANSSDPDDLAINTSQIRSAIPLVPQPAPQLLPTARPPLNLVSISEAKIERDFPSEASDGRLDNFLGTRSVVQPGQTLTAQRSEFSNPIVRQITDAVHARITAEKLIEVSLNPAELGRLKLSLSPAENGLVINVTAERPETLEMIKRNISDLEQAFTEQGHENISFSFEHNENSSDPDQNFEGYSTSIDDPQVLTIEPIATSQDENARPPTSGVDIRV